MISEIKFPLALVFQLFSVSVIINAFGYLQFTFHIAASHSFGLRQSATKFEPKNSEIKIYNFALRI